MYVCGATAVLACSLFLRSIYRLLSYHTASHCTAPRPITPHRITLHCTSSHHTTPHGLPVTELKSAPLINDSDATETENEENQPDECDDENSEQFEEDVEDTGRSGEATAFSSSDSAFYSGDAAEYESVLENLKNLSNYSVGNLKLKIIYFAGKNNKINVDKFLEKKELKCCLQELLLSKLTVGDLRILLTNEMKSQNIADNNKGNSSAYVSYADVIAECDKRSLIDMLLKSSSPC